MTLKDGHAHRRQPPRRRSTTWSATSRSSRTARSARASNARKYSQAAHGAQFAEVAVNAVTGEVRVRRMLGVFEAGRILNAKTARSQAIGGMIWGIGYALIEDAVLDKRYGQFVNHDLGEYHVPVNADVPQIEVDVHRGARRHANPIGVKGMGELRHFGRGRGGGQRDLQCLRGARARFPADARQDPAGAAAGMRRRHGR